MPHTSDRPKCLINIGDKPIIHYQLSALEQNRVLNIVIVGGYRQKQIENYVREHFPHMYFVFVHNKRYATTNDIFSLYLARRYFLNGFFLLDSDVLFHPKIVQSVYGASRSAVGLRLCRCGQEEMKIQTDTKRKVIRMSKSIDPDTALGEFIGVSFFDKKFARFLHKSLEFFIKKKMKKLDRECAIERVLERDRVSLSAIDITRYPAVEIDFASDLKYARGQVLPKISKYFTRI